jgi:hypothetical protein
VARVARGLRRDVNAGSVLAAMASTLPVRIEASTGGAAVQLDFSGVNPEFAPLPEADTRSEKPLCPLHRSCMILTVRDSPAVSRCAK